MKPAPFDKTPEFQNFTAVMKRLILVPKAELDARMRIEIKKKRVCAIADSPQQK